LMKFYKTRTHFVFFCIFASFKFSTK